MITKEDVNLSVGRKWHVAAREVVPTEGLEKILEYRVHNDKVTWRVTIKDDKAETKSLPKAIKMFNEADLS